MEVHQVRYFLAVCDALHFTRAAEQCHVSQPSLTRAIRALEDELGGPLFHRERNNSHLTDLGRLLKPYLEQVWTNMNVARDRAQEFVKLKDAPLTVGIMCTIGPTKLLDPFSKFHADHPGVELNLRDGTAEALQDALAKGDLDVAIYGLPGGIDERFHVQPLFTERFVIIAAPSHRFARMDAVRFRDLHRERYLARSKCEIMEQFLTVARDLGVEPIQPYVSERDDWIEAMVLAGWGFSFFPECAVIADGLVRRPLIEPEFTRTVNLVTVRGRPHGPAVGAFVREVMRHPWRGDAGPSAGRVAAA